MNAKEDHHYDHHDDDYVLSIDQGTTSTRAILFDHSGNIVKKCQEEFEQTTPNPGEVEHDVEVIWKSVLNVLKSIFTYLHNINNNNNIISNSNSNSNSNNVMEEGGVGGVGGGVKKVKMVDEEKESELEKKKTERKKKIVALGITNQRETTVVWNKHTGKAVYNAIVWQDKRTAEHCEQLKAKGFHHFISKTTGLVCDSYFSATKLSWILTNVLNARVDAERGDLLFGTIECFLLWRLTQGRSHISDISNAARTMMYDIHNCKWSDEILKELNIPKIMLPKVSANSDHFGEFNVKAIFAHQPQGRTGIGMNKDNDNINTINNTNTSNILPDYNIPITGMAGDQQAATFGQACLKTGLVKNTYGTGCFMLFTTGNKAVTSHSNLLTTIAWKLNNRINTPVTYAIEGAVFNAGSAIQWLRDSMGLIKDASETESIATSIKDTGGVYVVPAFSGLGAPYWVQDARGIIIGLTRGTGRAEIVRATLESIAFQTRDLMEAMKSDCERNGVNLGGINGQSVLRVDGGAVVNNFLMQFQADILGMSVERPTVTETTALGAAFFAGLTVNYWKSTDELQAMRKVDRVFHPRINDIERERLYQGWKTAVKFLLPRRH